MDNPHQYINKNVLQTRDALSFMERELERCEWGSGEKVLDVGCGPGDITSCLAAFLPLDSEIVGCDISQEMINYASKQYIGRRKTIFKLLNIEDECLPNDWEEETFNKIFSFYCLQWVADHRQSAMNMYTLLKTNGEFYGIFPPVNPMYLVLREFSKDSMWEKYINKIFDTAFTSISLQNNCENWEEEYSKILEDVGFKNVKVKIIQETFWYQSIEAFLDILEAVDPVKKCIPDEMKESYDKKFTEIILKERFAIIHPVSGKVYVHYKLAQIYAKKL